MPAAGRFRLSQDAGRRVHAARSGRWARRSCLLAAFARPPRSHIGIGGRLFTAGAGPQPRSAVTAAASRHVAVERFIRRRMALRRALWPCGGLYGPAAGANRARRRCAWPWVMCAPRRQGQAVIAVRDGGDMVRFLRRAMSFPSCAGAGGDCGAGRRRGRERRRQADGGSGVGGGAGGGGAAGHAGAGRPPSRPVIRPNPTCPCLCLGHLGAEGDGGAGVRRRLGAGGDACVEAHCPKGRAGVCRRAGRGALARMHGSAPAPASAIPGRSLMASRSVMADFASPPGSAPVPCARYTSTLSRGRRCPVSPACLRPLAGPPTPPRPTPCRQPPLGGCPMRVSPAPCPPRAAHARTGAPPRPAAGSPGGPAL